MINVLSFSHPHVSSLFTEGLWGFPEDRKGVNKSRWDQIEVGSLAVIYGDNGGRKGAWLLGEVVEKFENRKPVRYWIKNPQGYPLQVKLKSKAPLGDFSLETLGSVKSIFKEELASIFRIPIFKAKMDRWSLLIFKDAKVRGVTYSYSKFKNVLDEFVTRNRVIVIEKPDHNKVRDIIYEIGVIQGRNPEKEYPINSKRIDVVWRRTARSVPSVAFEVQFRGNIFEALTKLKHAYDLWNSIPVMVTTEEQEEEAKNWIKGAFHELESRFRIITWERIKEYYQIKREAKDFEMELGIG